MKKILHLIAILFVCASIPSCQKDPVNRLDPPSVFTPLDSVTRLSKLIFIDYRVSATDTLGYNEYLYDSLQRVITINSYDGNYGDSSIASVFTFYYNGNDSLAYKKTEVNIDPDPSYAYSITTFYFYDNLNRLIKDSSLSSFSDVEIGEYTYSDTMIVAIHRWAGSSDPIEIDSGFIGSNGNVIKINSLINYSQSSEYLITNFTYDNKPNPFNQLNIRTTYRPVPDPDFFLEDDNLLKNNVVLYTNEHPLFPGQIDSGTYTYTYNSSGLPALIDVAYSFGQTDDIRMIFIYKKI